MKVLCLRYPRNTVTDILICLLCVFIIALILINADYGRDVRCVVENTAINEFLVTNGWVADIDSGSLAEKRIPEVFDETYMEYACLQKKQGFDIESYKGKKITMASYPLRNYPGYENDSSVFISFMIYNGVIIGADIHSTSINGFITGAVRNGNNQT